MVPTSSGPPRVLPTGGSHWGTRLCPGSRGGERPGWAAGGTGTGPRHLGAQHRVLVLAGARCNRRAVPCAPTPQPRCLSRPVPRHSCPSGNRSRVGPRSGPPEKGWHRHRTPQPGRGRGWGHGSALWGCPHLQHTSLCLPPASPVGHKKQQRCGWDQREVAQLSPAPCGQWHTAWGLRFCRLALLWESQPCPACPGIWNRIG